MTNEELYHEVIKPRLDTIDASLKDMKAENTSEHITLTNNVSEVHDRMFKTNGKQSVTDNLSQLNSESRTHRQDIIALKKRGGRRSSDTPISGKDKAAMAAKATGKWTAIAAMFVAIMKLLEGVI